MRTAKGSPVTRIRVFEYEDGVWVVDGATDSLDGKYDFTDDLLARFAVSDIPAQEFADRVVHRQAIDRARAIGQHHNLPVYVQQADGEWRHHTLDGLK